MNQLNSTISNLTYPEYSYTLIECLERDFTNKVILKDLPTKELSMFELGRFIGHQDVISKLRDEQHMN